METFYTFEDQNIDDPPPLQIKSQMFNDVCEFFFLEVWEDLIKRKVGPISNFDLFESIHKLSMKKMKEIENV